LYADFLVGGNDAIARHVNFPQITCSVPRSEFSVIPLTF